MSLKCDLLAHSTPYFYFIVEKTDVKKVSDLGSASRVGVKIMTFDL